MNSACELCGGACCESVTLEIKDPDKAKWLEFHGKKTEHGITLECKCSKLKLGKCSIWSERPQVCRDYQVGSPACIDAVKRRRPLEIQGRIFQLIGREHGKEKG